eukprot:PhM_4_TR14346/c0_g1_i1/m.24924
MAYRSNRIARLEVVVPPPVALVAAENGSSQPRITLPETNIGNDSRALVQRIPPAVSPSPHRRPVPVVISLDNFEAALQQQAAFGDGNAPRIEITSPRSLHACAQHGIDQSELMPLTVQYFERTLPPGVTHNALGQHVRVEMSIAERRSMAQQRYENYESRRQEKLRLVRSSREQIISNELHNATGAITDDNNYFQQDSLIPSCSSPARARAHHRDPANLEEERNMYLQERDERRRAVDERRRQVIERAKFIKDMQQEHLLQQQIAKEEAHREQFRRRMMERQQVTEQKRMQQDRQRENAERLKRQQMYKEMQQRTLLSDELASSEFDEPARAVARDVQRYRVQAAKSRYMTPEQRYNMPRVRSTPARSRVDTGRSSTVSSLAHNGPM